MRKTTVTTMKRQILIALTAWICGGWTSQAANMPQYQFYSTSMLSPNKQSNYTPSHINQSGTVKVQLSANRRVPLYQMGVKNGNLRVFSAEAFTKPVSGNGGVVIVGSYVAGNANANANAKNGSSLNSSFSNSLSGLKLYTLATASQSSASANANANANAERQSAKIQRRTWLNIDEVERLEELENLALDSLRKAVPMPTPMPTPMLMPMPNESLVTADRRRAPGTPGSEGEQLPIGDALLPLLLFAAAYAALRFRFSSAARSR